jgi:hypothetical protein
MIRRPACRQAGQKMRRSEYAPNRGFKDRIVQEDEDSENKLVDEGEQNQ